MKSFLKSRSCQICILACLYLFFVPYLPEQAPSFFYTISTLIKDLLLWLLPLTVTFFVGYAVASFGRKAFWFVLSLFLFEMISNACSVWYAYGCAHLVNLSFAGFQFESPTNFLEPLWKLPLTRPFWWSADKGTIVGIFLGGISVFSTSSYTFLKKGKSLIEKILTSFFARLIPLFVLGFIAKMERGNILSNLALKSPLVFLFLILILSVYICFLFLLGNGKAVPSFCQRVKNLMPAAGLALSSGCSLSTMPWTISGSSKNLQNPELAKGVIPATTNIQQIGDCIVNCFFCFLLFYQFNGYPVPFSSWVLFSTVFILARFATAAVLGGAIFLMLPIYETYLGFTPEMIGLILALNVLLDPLVTSANVITNGALCRVFEKYWLRLQGKTSTARSLT